MSVIDLQVDPAYKVTLDFDRRQVWVSRINSAGLLATSFATFEQLAGVAYKVQGAPVADKVTAPAAA